MSVNSYGNSKVNQLLRAECVENDLPGASIGAYKNGKKIFEYNYGYRDVNRRLPVTTETIFPAASVTKSFTALAIMLLESDGKINVNDSIKDWLPELKIMNAEISSDIKIHHLLNNTSGLPALGAINLARAKSIKNDPDGPYM